MTESGFHPHLLLLDQGMPADAARLFRELGYQCLHVSELGLQRAEDEEILAFAGTRGCVVITLDADFHTLVRCSGSQGSVGNQAAPRGLQGGSSRRYPETRFGALR